MSCLEDTISHQTSWASGSYSLSIHFSILGCRYSTGSIAIEAGHPKLTSSLHFDPYGSLQKVSIIHKKEGSWIRLRATLTCRYESKYFREYCLKLSCFRKMAVGSHLGSMTSQAISSWLDL